MVRLSVNGETRDLDQFGRRNVGLRDQQVGDDRVGGWKLRGAFGGGEEIALAVVEREVVMAMTSWYWHWAMIN